MQRGEILPVIASTDYDRQFGSVTARALVRDHVLRLTYTAHDMAPFAHDLGYDGPPFSWDAEERRHLRARLDALYFHLYGLSRNDASYVLDTFPILRREDEKAFGHYPHAGHDPRLHECLSRRGYGHQGGGVNSTRHGQGAGNSEVAAELPGTASVQPTAGVTAVSVYRCLAASSGARILSKSMKICLTALAF